MVGKRLKTPVAVNAFSLKVSSYAGFARDVSSIEEDKNLSVPQNSYLPRVHNSRSVVKVLALLHQTIAFYNIIIKKSMPSKFSQQKSARQGWASPDAISPFNPPIFGH